MNNLHVKTGDNVMIISGKDKGHTGKVLQVSPSENKVIVEGQNMVTKHVKPRRQGEQAGPSRLSGRGRRFRWRPQPDGEPGEEIRATLGQRGFGVDPEG